MAGADEVLTTRPGLRERRREATRAEILDVARRLLARDGAAALSLREVAREMGMAVSALYRYVRSREDLITELLVQAYDDHADAVDAAAAAAGPGARAQLVEAFRSYRDWALADPVRYGLMYGQPLPDYEAPVERTQGPGTRVNVTLTELLRTGWETGGIDPAVVDRRDATLGPEHRRQLEAFQPRWAPGLPPALLALALEQWWLVRGMVSSEVFGHLRPVYGDVTPVFEEALQASLDRTGVLPRGAT